jgi:hypothetical protein
MNLPRHSPSSIEEFLARAREANHAGLEIGVWQQSSQMDSVHRFFMDVSIIFFRERPKPGSNSVRINVPL